jgi:hypothetical protein
MSVWHYSNKKEKQVQRYRQADDREIERKRNGRTHTSPIIQKPTDSSSTTTTLMDHHASMMGVRNNSPTGADNSQNDKAEINKDIDTTTQTESRRNLGHVGNDIEKKRSSGETGNGRRSW